MMDCGCDYDKLLVYTLGQGGEEDRGKVREHLASCAACTEESRLLSLLGEALRGLPEVAPSPEVGAALVREMEKRQYAAHRWAGLFKRPAAAMAAAGAIAVIVVTAWWRGGMFRPIVQREIAVREMGSTIAHRAAPHRGIDELFSIYCADSREVLDALQSCAKGRSIAAWNRLKEKVAEKEMVYRTQRLLHTAGMESGVRVGGDAEDLPGVELLEALGPLYRTLSRAPAEDLAEGGEGITAMVKRDEIRILLEGGNKE